MVSIRSYMLTISSFVEYLSVEQGLSSNTVIAYSRDIEMFVDFLVKQNFSSVDTKAIDEYCKSIYSLSKITIRRKISSIKSWIHFCQGEHSWNINVDFPDLGKCGSKTSLIASESLNNLRNITQNDDHYAMLSVIVEFLYGTGLRISALLNITFEDVKPVLEGASNRIITKGKGGKEHVAIITDDLAKKIKDYCIRFKVRCGYLWVLKGKCISRNTVYNWIRKACIKHGLEHITPHALRHRLASDLLQGNMNIMKIQKVLGHASVATTERYTHLEDHVLKDAVLKYHPLGHGSVNDNIHKS